MGQGPPCLGGEEGRVPTGLAGPWPSWGAGGPPKVHGPSWGGTQEIAAIMCFLGLALKARLRAKLCHARISVGLEFVKAQL